MSIDPKLLVSNFPVIMGSLGLLIGGKTVLVALVGRVFGVSIISAIRVGLLLAPGGEFAFVAFGEAVNQVSFPNYYIFSMLHKFLMCLSAVIQQGIVVFYTKSTNWLAYVFNIFCVFVVVSKCLCYISKRY